jgi:hypothetical protein
MYIKINATNKTMTLCKLIFSKSNKNIADFNWIYNRTNGFNYKTCECDNLYECKSKNIKNDNNYAKYKSPKYK